MDFKTCFCVAVVAAQISLTSSYSVTSPSNDENAADRHLLVLSVPPIRMEYYSSVYDKILDFHVEYASAVLGKDNVVVLGDRASINILKEDLPDDILLPVNVGDIWLRDFTSVSPRNPVQFRYTAAAMDGSQADADYVQYVFNRRLVRPLRLSMRRTRLKLDGGNLVDNYVDKLVVTQRFQRDNRLRKAAAKRRLKRTYRGVKQVAIIKPDDPILAHADGMVMFLDTDVLAVSDMLPSLNTTVFEELERSFPNTTLVQLPPSTGTYQDFDSSFSHACGLMVNGVMTNNYLYVPTFNEPGNADTLAEMQSWTNKEVVGINALNVCTMGGSVRCLTWQQTGNNAKKIIRAARRGRIRTG